MRQCHGETIMRFIYNKYYTFRLFQKETKTTRLTHPQHRLVSRPLSPDQDKLALEKYAL